MSDARCESEPFTRDPAGPVEIAAGPVEVSEILAARRGPGANCSSIGSALDLLFMSSVAAGVVLASVAAALGDEDRSASTKSREGDKPNEDAEASDAGEG